MNSEWSLEVLYKGFDDPKFAADFEKFDGIIGKINSLAEGINSMQPKEAVMSYLTLSEELSLTMMSLYMYASLRSSANTKDAEAQSVIGRLMAKISGTTRADTVIKKYIAEIPELDAIIESEPMLKEYEYLLHCIREDNKHMLSDQCEEIMALYDISGGSAWSDLQSYLTSSVTADYRGEKLGLSSIRNLAYDPDPTVRKDAYEAELACYEKIKDSVAFSLNSIKLPQLFRNRSYIL